MRLASWSIRWSAASLGAVGVLLAAPSIVWPVLVTRTFAEDDFSFAGPSSTQATWSWGKYAMTGFGDSPTDPMYEVSNTVGLLCAVVSLVIGAGAFVAWTWAKPQPGRSLGVAGVSFLLAAQLVFIAQWVGQRQSSFVGENRWIQTEQQPAGWLQVASVAVLLGALGFMLWQPVRPVIVSTWRHLTGREPAEPLVEAEPTDAGPPVGFSDDGSH